MSVHQVAPFTAEEAYLAALEDFFAAHRNATHAVKKGLISQADYEKTFEAELDYLRQLRVDRGQLPQLEPAELEKAI